VIGYLKYYDESTGIVQSVDYVPERRKRIRSAGFLPHGARRAVRLRKISAGGNVGMEDARRFVRGMVGGDGQE